MAVGDITQHNAKTIYGAVDSLSTTVTSIVQVSKNLTWPNVTVPNFNILANLALETSGADFMAISSIINTTTKAAWEAYSFDSQAWLAEGVQKGSPIESIPKEIHPLEDATFGVETGEYLPVWQMFPAPDPSAVNFNLLSALAYDRVFYYIIENKEPVLSETVDVTKMFGADAPNSSGHPQSLIIIPVLQSLAPSDSTAVVALLSAAIQWDLLFQNILHRSARGVVVVVRSSCEDEFTYSVEGSGATFLGLGDLHDSQYNDHLYIADFDPFSQLNASNGNSTAGCNFKLFMYPSDELHAHYHTSKPGIMTFAVVMVFVVTTAAFATYDCLVERRQEIVMESAAKTNAIVSSLFPKEVRERLFTSSGSRKKKKASKDKILKAKGGLLPSLTEAPKFRLHSFLHDDVDQKNNGEEPDSMPIADLFPHCTVIFADIAGFTAWSSVREPSQVFRLLENVYGAFDAIAKRRHVFKV